MVTMFLCYWKVLLIIGRGGLHLGGRILLVWRSLVGVRGLTRHWIGVWETEGKLAFGRMLGGGGVPFRDKYPRLFSISNQKGESVGDMVGESSPNVVWNFEWRRWLFVWEEHLLDDLREELVRFRPCEDEDGWRWRLEDNGRFTVKSSYEKLVGLVMAEDLWCDEEKKVFSRVWKSPAPSKAVAFSWKLLLNRIPTRENLELRNALPPEVSSLCVMCGFEAETANHLFLHCPMTSRVWRGLMRWLDFDFLIPPNMFIFFLCWSGWERNKKIRRGLWLIWHAAIWVIWRVRNNRIFNNQVTEVDELVEEVKVLSWRWTLNRINIPACMFYEWCWNPKECLKR